MLAPPKLAGPAAGLVLSLLGGALLLALAAGDLYLEPSLETSRPTRFTVRVPAVRVQRDPGAAIETVRATYPPGHRLGASELALTRAFEEGRRPPQERFLLGLGLVFFLALLLYTTHLRRGLGLSTGRRSLIVLLLGLLLLATGAKALLIFTPWSAYWIPIAALVIPVAVHLGVRAAAATALTGAMVCALLTPVDWILFAVLLAQGLAAAFSASRRRRLRVARAALAATLASAVTFGALGLALDRGIPLHSWSAVFGVDSVLALLASDPCAATLGALVGSGLAGLSVPLFRRLLGIVSRARLLGLSNLDSPLLKHLASRAPGTWAHSMTMANMAELAANAIGADPLLVRVGAYYHDLGKALQPEYYIENQEGTNPHDGLAPQVSADAIFSHVVDGLKLARKQGLPAEVLEAIWTHHGDGLLEYFWHKNVAAGNPQQLDERDFRYPGFPPISREAAILSLCDAVEAASRTLEETDEKAIRQLVRQIVLTKLEQGLLRDSDLSLAELQMIIDSLVDTLKSSRHGRIKYPWQEGRGPEGGAGGDRPDRSRPRMVTKPMGAGAGRTTRSSRSDN